MDIVSDIISSYTAEPRVLSRVSSDVRQRIKENDLNIIKGLQRTYNEQSIYVIARDAIMRDDPVPIEKLALEYSGWLPIPWDYLSQFVKSKRMFDLVVRKMSSGDSKAKLVARFGTPDQKMLIDNRMVYTYSCDGEISERRFFNQLSARNLGCITVRDMQHIRNNEVQFQILLRAVLQSEDLSLIDKLGLTREDFEQRIIEYPSDYASPTYLQWMKDNGIQLNMTEELLLSDNAPVEFDEYIFRHGLLKSYFKHNLGSKQDVHTNLMINNPVTLQYARDTQEKGRLGTPEQISEVMPNNRAYYTYDFIPAAIDMKLNNQNTIQFLASQDAQNIINILKMRGVNTAWFEYYFGRGPKPEGSDNQLLKKLITEGIKSQAPKYNIEQLIRFLQPIDENTRERLIDLILREYRDIKDRDTMVEYVRHMW